MKNKKYFFIVIGIVLVLVLYLWLFKSKYSIFDRYKAIYYSLDFDNEFVLKNIENEGGVLKYVIEGKGDYSKVVSRINEYLQLNLESDICGMKISVCFWDDICKWNYIVFDNYSFYVICNYKFITYSVLEALEPPETVEYHCGSVPSVFLSPIVLHLIAVVL